MIGGVWWPRGSGPPDGLVAAFTDRPGGLASRSHSPGNLVTVTGATVGTSSGWFESASGDHGVVAGHAEAFPLIRAAVDHDPRTLSDEVASGWAGAWTDRDGRLVLSRDDLGLVPLYFRQVGAAVAFATSLADLCGLSDDPDRVDLQILEFRLNNLGAFAGQRTTVTGIHRVRHNTRLTVGPGGAAAYLNWRPPRLPWTERSFEQSVDAVRLAIDCAVGRSLEGSRAPAVHLSGGLDSGVIAAAAAGRGVSTAYSWSSPAAPGRVTEWHTAQDQARLLGLDLTGVPAQAALAQPLDPVLDPVNTVWREVEVLRHARSIGTDRILSGWGGDEAVSAAVSSHLHRALPRWPGRAPRLLADSRTSSWPAHLARSVHRAAGSERRKRASDRALMAGTQGLLHPPDIRQVEQHLRRWGARGDPTLWRVWGGGIQVRTEDWWELGRRNGVAYRFPLLDRDLVLEVLRTPFGHRNRGEGRSLMRGIAREIGFAEAHLRTPKAQPGLTERLRARSWMPTPLLLDRWPHDAPAIERIYEHWSLRWQARHREWVG